MRNKIYTFEDHLKESLKDQKFRKVWEESEVEYQLAKKIIEARLKRNLSQRDLAKKLKTSQAVVSRLETMSANPSLSLLKRLAHALGAELRVGFK